MDQSPLSLDDVALFVEVARRRSFTHAANRLNIPASTLSRRIRALEERIGVRLLQRSTRRVELTEAGAAYFERCHAAIDQASQAHEALEDMIRQPKGTLRISMPTSLALRRMPAILHAFCLRYPGIECDLNLGIQPIDFVTDPYDVVIRFGQPPDSSVLSRRIGAIRLGLYASAGYLARHPAPRTPQDLAHHQCIRTSTQRKDSQWTLWHDGESATVDIHGQLAVNNITMLFEMARRDMGIVQMTDADARGDGDTPALVPVLPQWRLGPTPLLALFPSRMLPLKTRAFIDFLAEHLQLDAAASA